MKRYLKTVLVFLGILVQGIIIIAVLIDCDRTSEKTTQRSGTSKPAGKAIEVGATLQQTIDEISTILSNAGADAQVSARETQGGRVLMTIAWLGFQRFPVSEQKDMAHALMQAVVGLRKDGGHEIIFKNQVREVAKVTHSSWSGIKVELY